MGNDMFNDEQLAHAEIVQKETEDALGFWKDRALKAEAKLADKYLIEEQYEAACGDRDGLLRMVETLREQKNALLAEATRTSLRYLTERDDWFAAYQRTEALRLEAVQGMVAAERELGEARAEVSPQATTDAGMTLAECIRHQRQLLEEKTCQHAEALSRARETDGASSTLVPERPGESPSRCGLAFGQCRYQRRAAAKSCALLNTPTPELDMTHVLFPGSRPKPNPKTEDGAVREAAERLNATGEEMARLDENNFADSFAALHVLAPRFIREAKALLSALSSPPRPGAEAPITCEEVGCPTCCPSPRPATKAPTFTHWSGSATKPDAPPAEAATEAAPSMVALRGAIPDLVRGAVPDFPPYQTIPPEITARLDVAETALEEIIAQTERWHDEGWTGGHIAFTALGGRKRKPLSSPAPAPPAEAATEDAVTAWARLAVALLARHEPAWDHDPGPGDDDCDEDCRACEYVALLRTGRAALSAPPEAPSTDPWRACGCAEPDNCEHVFRAPAPSEKETR